MFNTVIGIGSIKRRMLIRSFGLVLAVLGTATVALAVDPLSALDLVSSDVALCLEIPNLDDTWTKLEQSPLMDRLRAFPPSQHFFESPGIQKWKTIEKRVADQTGKNLSEQLRSIFARELVLAMYVPAEGDPQGILIGEAKDAAAITTFFATWNALEPTAVKVIKSHRGSRYIQRKRHPNAEDCLYFASSDRWFAVSDHESLIQDVIDRFNAATGVDPTATLSNSLRRSNHFARNRERLKKNASAYAHVGARPWDRSLQESSDGMNNPISPAAIWSHISYVSCCLQFDQGVVCETVVELDKSNLPRDWSQFVMTASGGATWDQRIPAEAILAIGGRLELAPFVRQILDQILPEESRDFSKYRRAAQSLLGGQELFDVVLPALARDFCGYVSSNSDQRTKRIALDGMLGFTLDSPADGKLLQNVNNGLETAVKLLAAYFSAETQDVVVVNREQTESTQICWTSPESPFPVALGIKERTLVVTGSRERLLQSFAVQMPTRRPTRLVEHSSRYFPNANQLAWFDLAQMRKLLKTNGTEIAGLLAQSSDDDRQRLVNRFEQIAPTLELLDSVFLAGRIEYDHIHITYGGGLDSN